MEQKLFVNSKYITRAHDILIQIEIQIAYIQITAAAIASAKCILCEVMRHKLIFFKY